MVHTTTVALPHGISLHCRTSGHPDQPLLVFLHGFPEGAFVWDALLQKFGSDFYCVAPDLRGYGRSSQPPHVEDYRPKLLVQDLAALIHEVSAERTAACVVAHDWGGALAWNLANQQPQLMQKLCILNAPHPGAFLRELQSNPAQQAASQYMHYLRRPEAPAQLLAHNAKRLFGFFKRTDGSFPEWLTAELRSHYLEHWQQGMQGPCAYYGASPLVPPRGSHSGAHTVQLPDAMLRIEVPTHVIWGEQDVALLGALLDGLEQWVPQLQIHRLPEAGHWLVHEAPQEIESLLRTQVLK